MDTIESTFDDVEQNLLVATDSSGYDDGGSGSYDDGGSGSFDDGSSGDGGSGDGGSGDGGSGDGGSGDGGSGDGGSGDGGSDGPGVRTPGFWSQKNWQKFWDGTDGNEPNQAGEPGFASGEITYVVDDPGTAGTTMVSGLLIGDYDMDGVTDEGENTIFLSLDDARTILNASQKDPQDMQFVLGRDVVATWLNHLAGNPIADTDSSTVDPQDYLDWAIEWLQYTTGGSGNPMDPSETLASSTEWNVGIDFGGDGVVDPAAGDIPAGNAIHEALDEYNNFGTINGVFYAPDADSFV